MDKRVENLIKQEIKKNLFQSCVIGIIIHTPGGVYEKQVFYFGNCNENSIFDVASITKTVSTGFLIMKLLEENKINLEDKIQKYFPKFKNAHATIENLLTYKLDFKNFTEKEKENRIKNMSVEEFRDGIFDLELETQPGTVYKYSDATADLQGRLIEQIYGENLNILFDKYIKTKFDLKNSTLEPKNFQKENVIPTQILEDGVIIQGIVNDPKARKSYKAGYFSGCAGLFSDVNDLLNVAEKFLEQKYETLNKMLENNFCIGDNSVFELIPILQEGKGKDKKYFGKSGFTGCLIFGELNSGTALVFLSNRTFPDGNINYPEYKVFREKLLDLIF